MYSQDRAEFTSRVSSFFKFTNNAFSFRNLRKFAVALMGFLLVFAFISLAPAKSNAQPINPGDFSSFFGIGQYILSFFGDDASNIKKALPPPPPSLFEPKDSQATKASRHAPPQYPESALPCGTSSTTINVASGGSIQTAINAASFFGDTIQLAAGTYTEQIEINKCVHIVGAGEGSTTIQAPATLNQIIMSGVHDSYAIVSARANAYVTISDLSIKGPLTLEPRGLNDEGFTAGVSVLEGASLEMTNVTVSGIHGAGGVNGTQNGIGVIAGRTAFNQVGEIKFTNVTVEDYNKGGIIVARAGSKATITNSEVAGAGPVTSGMPAQNGIQITDGATATITGSTVRDNFYIPNDWAATGILPYNAGPVTISGNTFIGNSEAIYNYYPTQVTSQFNIENNSFEGADWAIIAWGVNANISNNSFNNNGIAVGAYVYDTSVVNIISNSITNSTVAGIDLDKGDDGDSAANAQITASFNRIAGNDIGASNLINGILHAENNFWGCNEGPTPDGSTSCDTAEGTGPIVSTPWLKLSGISTVETSLETGETSAISGVSLRVNSDDVDTYNTLPGNPHILDGLTVNYSATNGSIAPTSGTFTNGIATGTTFTAGGPFAGDQTAVITAALDSASDSVNITVEDTTDPSVSIVGQTSPTTTGPVTFTVTFSEPVVGFDGSHVDLSLSQFPGSLVATATESGPMDGTTYTVSVTGLTGPNVIRAKVNAGVVNDTAGNPNTASPTTAEVEYAPSGSGIVVDDQGINCLADGSLVVNSIPAAVAAASPGYTIKVCPGTYTQSGGTTLNLAGLSIVNALPIDSNDPVNRPTINVSGTSIIFTVLADHVRMEGLGFVKTDTAAVQNVIQVQGTNFTAKNNEFTATTAWNYDDPNPSVPALDIVTRAFEISGTATGLLIDGNTITGFRQPAYINGAAGNVNMGSITNNISHGTKGWVLAEAIVDMSGNTFGQTCSGCGADIALVDSDTNPSNPINPDFINHFEPYLDLSGNNDNAYISVQVPVNPSPSGRKDTYVDDDAAANGDGRTGQELTSIQTAVDNTLPGGTVHVAAGTYSPGSGLPANAQVLINRTISVVGTSGAEATFIDGTNTATPQAGLFRVETSATADGDTNISGFTFRNMGAGPGSRTAVYTKPLSPSSIVTVSNNRFAGTGATSEPYDQALYAYHPRGKVVFSNNFVSGFGGNPVLLEQPEGGSDVNGNVFANNNSTAVFNMTYAISSIPVNIASVQRVANNTFYGTSASAISINGAFGSAGNYSNVEITDNVIHQLGASRTGINLSNGSVDGASGEISNATVTGNRIVGVNASGSRGIRLAGLISNTDLSCNMIASTADGIVADAVNGNEPTGAAANNNNLSGNRFGVRNNGTSLLNAQSNFWGADDGPAPTGSGDEVSSNVDSSGFLLTPSTCAPALPETHGPSSPGWYYYDDVAESGIMPNDYAYGPGSPVLGIGSARMNPSSLGTTKLLFATLEFAGTRLADINHFSYFTYVTSGDAPYVQMGIDADLTDSDDSWQGRIVWVPSANGTVVPGGWQYWDANEGLYYATQLPVRNACPAANPCTKAELISAFPNIGLSNGPGLGLLGFRSDDASNASVDAVSVGTSSVFKTFDFEPVVPTLDSITHSPAGPTNQPITFTVTFSEPVTGFDDTDTVFTGISGTHTVTGGPTVYTVTFTPDAGQDGTLTLNIAASAANAVTGGAPTSNGGTDSVDFDNIAPGVTLSYLGVDPTNNDELEFEAVFTEDVSCFTAAGVTAVNGTVSNIQQSAPNTCTFTVTAASNGTVSATVNAGATTDAAGNDNTASATVGATFDDARPSATITYTTSDTSSVTYNVEFNEPVTGFAANDVFLGSGTTGGILSATVTDTGDQMNYTVVVTGMANNGNVVISVPENSANDLSGNGNTASNELITPFNAGETGVTVTPSSAPGQFWSYYNDSTNAPIAGYDFMFGPTGVTNGIGSAGLRTSVSIPGNPSQLLTFGTSSFNGTDLADITQLSYMTYVDSSSAGDVPTLQFNVDFDLTDSDVSYQGRVVWVPSQNGTVTNDTWQTWDIVTPSSLFWYSNLAPFASECTAGDPCTLADMLADHPNMGIHNTLGALLFRVQGNSVAAVDNLVVGVNSANTTFDFEPSVPSIVSITHSSTSPTNAASIEFTVTFSEPVAGFDDSDTVFTGISGTHTVTGGPTVYTVTFTPAANQTGTLSLNIAAGTSNGDPSGVPTSNGGSDSVAFDNAAPTATIDEAGGQTDPTSVSPINFAVEFGEPVTGFDASDIVLDPGTSGASNVVVTGSGTSYNVAVGGMNADGTITIMFAAGAAMDAVGNLSQAPVITDNSVDFILSNTNVVVTPADLQDWETVSQRTASSSLVTGIETPPIGTGSLRMQTGPGNSGPDLPQGGAGQGGKTWFTRSDLNTVALSAITELSYSTYVADRMPGTDVAPAINLQVDIDGNGTRDASLVYEPVYSLSTQGPIVEDQWQNWDALNGRWWFTGSSFTNDPSFPAQFCPSDCFNDWSIITAAFPNARIVNWYSLADGSGLAIVGGQNNAGGTWDNFDGNVDNFVIGVNSSNTTYDFEPTPPTIFVNDVTLVEGNSGSTSQATFTVSLSQPSQLATSVTVNTEDGTATAGSDYTAVSGLVVPIPAGQTTATFTVDILGDDVFEGNEAFTVKLSDAVNGAINDDTGIGTITDDESQPTVSISRTTDGVEPSTVGGTGTDNVFTVTLSGQSSVPVTVNYTTANGITPTATAGVDYTTTAGTITFPANTTTFDQTINVPTLFDTIAESTEYFAVNLSLPVGATIGTGSATGQITDSGAYISISGNISQFGGSGLGGVTVNLAGGATQSTVTDSNGNYTFDTGLQTGEGYLVTPVPTTGKIFDPISRNYDTVITAVTDADFIEYDINSIPRNVYVQNTYGTPGQDVVVPIMVESLGGETGFSFTVDFNQIHLNGVPLVECGSDAGASCNLTVNSSQLSSGKLGIIVEPESGLLSGNRELIKITFATSPTANSIASSVVSFSGSPINQSTTDGESNPLATMYTSGSVIFARGWEGDIAGRFEGNGPNNPSPIGVVNTQDIQLIRAFAAGNLIPNPLFNEFQRADTAPTSTRGNGSINTSDIQAIRSFAAGNTVPQIAGGPFGYLSPLANLVEGERNSSRLLGVSTATLTVTPQVTSPDQFITIPIRADFTGQVTGTQFNLDFDEAILENPTVILGPGVPSGTGLTTNVQHLSTGNLGIVIDREFPFADGTYDIVLITFHVKATASPGNYPLAFSCGIPDPTYTQCSTGNVDFDAVPTLYVDGAVTIAPSTAAGVAVQGKVVTPGGSPIANAQVFVTDEQGRSFSTRSNSFGNFGIKGVPGGRTYILTARAKGHSFQAQTVTLNESVTTVNLVSD